MLRIPRLESKVVATLFASGWMYIGRLTGLLWTGVIVARLDVGDYGQYAMAFAASGIAVSLIDNPFLVRSIRISDRGFERERRSRTGFALILVLVGVGLFQLDFVVGFAIIIAGGEIALNALKSQSLRSGLVDHVMLLDLVRQTISILTGAAYLFLHSDPNIEIASLYYASAYFLAVGVASVRFGLRVPLLPGGRREAFILSFGALAGAGYAQGDVLLLGFIAGDDAAGTYSIASMVAWSAAGLFLNHANAYVGEIRSGGSGLRLIRVVRPATLVASAVLILGIALAFLHLLDPLGPTLCVLSIFVVLRAINHVCTVTLTLGGKDITRFIATLTTALFDLGLVVLLVGFGSFGAAIAAVLSEVLLCCIYIPAYRRVVKTIASNIREPV